MPGGVGTKRLGVRPAAAGRRFPLLGACFRQHLEQARGTKAVPQGGPGSRPSLRKEGDKEWNWPKSTNSGGLRPGSPARSEQQI